MPVFRLRCADAQRRFQRQRTQPDHPLGARASRNRFKEFCGWTPRKVGNNSQFNVVVGPIAYASPHLAQHQQIVTAGSGDFPGALGDFLPLTWPVGPPLRFPASTTTRNRKPMTAFQRASNASKSGAATTSSSPPIRFGCLARRGKSGRGRARRHGSRQARRPATPRCGHRGRAPRPRRNRASASASAAPIAAAGQARSEGRNATPPWANRQATG